MYEIFRDGAKRGSALRQIADFQVRKAGKKARRVFPGFEAEPVNKVEAEKIDDASVHTCDTCDQSSVMQDKFIEEENKLDVSVDLKSLDDVEVKEEPKLQLASEPFVPTPTVEQLEYQNALLQYMLWTNHYNLLRFAAFRQQHLEMEQAYRQDQAERYLQKVRVARYLLECNANPVYRVTDSYLRREIEASIHEFVA